MKSGVDAMPLFLLDDLLSLSKLSELQDRSSFNVVNKKQFEMPEIILLSSPLSPAKAHHLGQVVKSLVWTFFFPFFVKTKSLYYYTSTYVAIEMGSKCGRGVALCILIHIVCSRHFLDYTTYSPNRMAFYNKY